jgi:RNA polymerase sigma-70 factor, ECF subfamily
VEDEDIRGALRRGDVDGAFRMLVQAHGKAVYGRCLRIMRSPGAAEDVMQQTLMAAFRSRAKLLEVEQIRGWLVRVAIRKSLDALRSSKRGARLQRELAGEEEAGGVGGLGGLGGAGAEDEASVLALLAGAEEKRAVEGCLAKLDPELAEAVLMRYRDGMSWEQIAEVLALPVDTIRMRVQRGALRSLRDCLATKEITS